MLAHRRRKITLMAIVLLTLSLATGLILFALKQNINLYFTPTQLYEQASLPQETIRLGGMVMTNSVIYEDNSLKMQFYVTDFNKEVLVFYEGAVPALFKEGKGIIVQGKMSGEKEFNATQVLAKHDENYMPPDIKQAG